MQDSECRKNLHAMLSVVLTEGHGEPTYDLAVRLMGALVSNYEITEREPNYLPRYRELYRRKV